MRSPVPSPLTPKTTVPPATETPNFRSRPERSRSTRTLPAFQSAFVPHGTLFAVLSAAAARIQNSIVKSVGSHVDRRTGAGIRGIVDRHADLVRALPAVSVKAQRGRARGESRHKESGQREKEGDSEP